MKKSVFIIIFSLVGIAAFFFYQIYQDFQSELRQRDIHQRVLEEKDEKLKADLDSIQSLVETITGRLNEMPPGMEEIFENFKKSVYKITVFKILEGIDEEEAALIPNVYKSRDGGFIKVSSGTAFCLFDRGLFLTNYHVYDPESEYALLEDYDGNKYQVDQVISSNPKLDYTYFACQIEDLQGVELVDDSPRVGEKAYTIGNPRGFYYTPSEGHIAGYRQGNAVMQVSMPVTFGNSGGPVLNAKGQVSGMIYAGIGDANLNFAINIRNIMMDLVNQVQVGINSEEYSAYYESLPDLSAFIKNFGM